jgi:NhaP-type Na+/H+ or K+/H+ antiporter
VRACVLPSQRLSFASNPDALNPAFSYTEALTFAALISAVDPVSTIAIFGNLGVDRTTSVILLGESILNDAVAIVLYHHLATAVVEEEALSFGDVLLLLLVVLWSFVASLVLGALAGLFGTLLVGRASAGTTHSNAQLQVSLVLLFAYIAYELAETMGFSGIVATLAAGIVTKRYAYTHMSEDGRALSKQSFGMLAQVRTAKHFTVLPLLSSTNEHICAQHYRTIISLAQSDCAPHCFGACYRLC